MINIRFLEHKYTRKNHTCTPCASLIKLERWKELKNSDVFAFWRDGLIVAWITHCRPEYACTANKCAQVTEHPLSSARITEIEKEIKCTLLTSKKGVRYPQLQSPSLHLRVYAESAFTSNDDLSLELWFIILLCDTESTVTFLTTLAKNPKAMWDKLWTDSFTRLWTHLTKVFQSPQNYAKLWGGKFSFKCLQASKKALISSLAARGWKRSYWLSMQSLYERHI